MGHQATTTKEREGLARKHLEDAERCLGLSHDQDWHEANQSIARAHVHAVLAGIYAG